MQETDETKHNDTKSPANSNAFLCARAKAAILSIASTALKFSAIALENESSVLSTWLPPIAALIQRPDSHQSDSQVKSTIIK